MSNKSKAADALLMEIPSYRCKPEQVARWCGGKEMPTHKLLRRPVNLAELTTYEHGLAIWRDNDTLTYVTQQGTHGRPNDDQRSLMLNFWNKGPRLYIVGKDDDAIAQTAAFFFTLEEPTEHSIAILHINMRDKPAFDFSAAQSQCFEHMLSAVPSRQLQFHNVKLSVQQSITLATRPYCISLMLSKCTFMDGGTAFVDALLNRTESFGSLDLAQGTDLPVSDENLIRLINVEKVGRLSLPRLADSLDYEITTSTLMKADIPSLLIFTAKLSIDIYHDGTAFPTECIRLFWRRVADLGHFYELKVRVNFSEFVHVLVPFCIVQELIRAVLENEDLEVLDLCDRESQVDLEPHLGTLFKGIKDHTRLLYIKVFVHNEERAFGHRFYHIRKLITHNRKIVVTDDRGDVHADGLLVDKIYYLNYFYAGSKALAMEPLSERLSLVATGLASRASNDFQRSALLLAYHSDALCELVQFANLDELNGHAPPSRCIQDIKPKRNRGRKMRRCDAKRK